MPEKNINSTTTLPTVLRPTPDESGMTVPQLLEHRINTLFEQIPLVAELGAVSYTHLTLPTICSV